MIYTDDSYIKETIFKRKTDSHKGDFGKVLIFAGSPGMAGAAVLCGRAALKAGAGLVQFLIPTLNSPIYPILQISVPEATCLPAFSDTEIHLSLDQYSAIAAGPGLGKSEESKKILSYIIYNYSGTLVLDADALNIISEDQTLKEAFRSSKAAKIITPHVGEAKRLLNTCAGIRGIEARKAAVCELAESLHSIALLKGADTLIAYKGKSSAEKPGFSVYENLTGNPGMATGGSGDTLTGIIASLAAQGYPSIDAARIGAFLHGKAGDLAAEQLSEMAVTASDIIAYLPAALKLYY